MIWPADRSRRDTRIIKNAHEEAIRHTNAFLDWALQQNRDLPRIPRCRIDQGGFAKLMGLTDPKKLTDEALKWWARALAAVKFDR